MATPTAHEQYMLELVNRARTNPNAEAQRLGIGLNDGLASGTISSSTKQALVFNFNLIDAARGHSQWMIDQDIFSHTGAGGSSARDRIIQSNYSFTGSQAWGENIARNGTSGTLNVTSTIASQHDGLFISEGHRENILSDNFREIGIGALQGEYEGLNALLTTQKFARSGNSVFLTGVAFNDAIMDDDFYTVGEGLGGINVTATNSSGQVFSTSTYSSGGYQLALNPGTYEIDFSSGTLGQTVVERTVTISDRNIKLDLATDQLSPIVSPPSPLSSDFNGDGQNDLLIYNPQQSWSGIGFMDQNGNIADATPLWTGWSPKAIGDFNNDGQTDIVIENIENDWHGILYMNGSTIQSSQGIAGWAGWDIIGAGNFHNDGTQDLLIQHETQNWYGILNMGGENGSQVQSSKGISFWEGWDIKGAGDFDGDGTSELVGQHQTEGWYGIFELNAEQQIVSSQGIAGWTGWDIVGTSDQNEDGKTDLLIKHPTQGWQGTLLMNGNQITGSQGLNIWQGWEAIA